MGCGWDRRALRLLIRHGFLCTLLFPVVVNEKVDSVKICVVPSSRKAPGHTTKYCDSLGKSKKSPVKCVFATDRLECLRLVSAREVDFTIMEPEDLYFSTLWDEHSVLVASEIRASREDPFKYGTVVVVKSGFNATGVDLRGKKLCHPGVKSGTKWNDVFAQYLEERLAPRQCEPGLSVFEDRIKTSADYFGISCKAGPWALDRKEDVRLKEQYETLCSLCDMGDCRNDERYRGSAGSILCFTDGLGDVLWARYDDVKTYFKKFNRDDDDDYGHHSPRSDYRLLCEDGSLKSVTDANPCFWLVMPWQVVGANPKSVNDVQKIFNNFSDSEWERNFVNVIETYLHFVVNLHVPKTPEDYLKSIPGYLSAAELSQGKCRPSHSVKWCASSAPEGRKCDAMSKAAASLGVEPPVECVVKSSVSSCLDSARNGAVDLVVVPADYALDAITRYGLSSIYNEISSSYSVSALVTKDSDIKTLSDLKGRKACFTRERGVGWNAILRTLRNNNFISSDCRGESDLRQFLGGLCVVRSDGGEPPACCSGDGFARDADAAAVDCLRSGGCDVAFVSGGPYKGGGEEWNNLDVRRVCAGEEESPDCSWYYVNPSSLMINSNVTGVKYQEINYLISQIEDLFGRTSKNDNNIMEMFGPFEKKRNVMFQDTSVTLRKSEDATPNEYQDIIDYFIMCSSASQCLPHLYLILPVIFFIFSIYTKIN